MMSSCFEQLGIPTSWVSHCPHAASLRSHPTLLKGVEVVRVGDVCWLVSVGSELCYWKHSGSSSRMGKFTSYHYKQLLMRAREPEHAHIDPQPASGRLCRDETSVKATGEPRPLSARLTRHTRLQSTSLASLAEGQKKEPISHTRGRPAAPTDAHSRRPVSSRV